MTRRPYDMRLILGTCVSLILLAFQPGCGGSGVPAADTAAGTGTNPETSANGSSVATAGSGKKRGRNEIYVDDKGQKWYGDIPYDVFFDEPYAVASNTTSLAPGATAVASNTPAASSDPLSPPVAGPGPDPTANPDPSASPDPPAAGTPTTPTPAAATPAAGKDGWDSLISASVLDDEVKSLRNFLFENLQTVGNYNSSMLMVPPKAAALGVLAAVAMEHPGTISWKDDAIYVRDLARQMNESPLQRGAKDQKRLLALFEAISDTLNRSKPAGLAEPSATDSFAEVAEMRLVMMRMEEAEKRMRTEAGSEGSFSSSKAMVQHEASILATMSHAVTRPGYGYEDDKEFVGFGQTVVEAAKSILAASEANDFPTYELSLSKIATTCQSCHSKFKND